MQDFCGLSGRANFRENHLKLLLEKGVVKMTIPDKPSAPSVSTKRMPVMPTSGKNYSAIM